MPPPEPTPTPVFTAPQQPNWATPPQAIPTQAMPPQAYYPDGSPVQYYGGAHQLSKTLGVVAFVAGLVVIIASPIASAFVGGALGHLVAPGSGFATGFAAGSNSHDPQTLLAGVLIIAQLAIGSGLGIWALIQGIIAVRTHRGRGWGIAAIVLAGVAPILSFVVYVTAIAVAHSAG